MGLIPEALLKLLQGTPFGTVYPSKPNPPPLAVDGRTVALRLLRKYVTNLTFYRRMTATQAPQAFSVKPENFHIEWPGQPQDLNFPAIVVVPAEAQYNPIGLTSYVEEATRDRFKQGTVVQWQSEYREIIKLEVWASEKSVRRAVFAGLEVALCPTEQMYGLRFRMPDYYDELVCFCVWSRELLDDRMSALNRRRGHLSIEMRFNIVALVNYSQLSPTIGVNTDVDDSGNPVVVEVT